MWLSDGIMRKQLIMLNGLHLHMILGQFHDKGNENKEYK